MTVHTIKEGNHYDDKIFSTWPWIKSSPSIKYKVSFDADCRYILPAYNQGDVNKLMGLCFGYRGIHYNSARFGWRWSETDQCIELLAYVYRKGQRNWDEQMRFPVVAQVKLGDVIEIELVCTKGAYIFYSQKPGEDKKSMVIAHESQLQWFGFTSSLFFGGEKPAPHTMHVGMERI